MGQDETKARLLDATLALISEKGYLGATTRGIAKRAGVTEITLFRHFGSKEHLFEAMLNSATFLPRMRVLLPELEGRDYPEALAVIGARFLETLGERRRLFKILNTEAHRYPGKIRKAYGKFIQDTVQELAGYLRTLQRRGALRAIDPATGAEAYLGMLVSYFRNEELVHNRTISPKDMKKKVREFVDIFAYGTAGNGRQRHEQGRAGDGGEGV